MHGETMIKSIQHCLTEHSHRSTEVNTLKIIISSVIYNMLQARGFSETFTWEVLFSKQLYVPVLE